MLYDIGFFIFSIFYLPTLIFKGKLHGAFAERFGVYNKAKKAILSANGRAIWIQAVSVGEVALCRNLIPQLKKSSPGSNIVISTITKTGNDLAKKLYSADATIIYFPLDFSFVVRRATKLIRPKLFVMIETEIWPNLLKRLAETDVPAVLINGRISDRSFGKYKIARPFLKKTLGRIKIFCMQSALDAERITQMGAPQDRIMITGNMKFDADISYSAHTPQDIKKRIGLEPDEDLLVAGSTHKGEEEALLRIFKDLNKKFPRLRLLIAPRHIERAGEVEESVKRLGLESVRVSKYQSVKVSGVLILDTIGQLKDIYTIATVVFVGGSLVKHGGQNPIEPASLGKPVIFGPHMFNFKNITDVLLKSAAAIQIADEKELAARLSILLADPDMRKALRENAGRAILENRGATQRNLDVIKELISI